MKLIGICSNYLINHNNIFNGTHYQTNALTSKLSDGSSTGQLAACFKIRQFFSGAFHCKSHF